MTRGEIDVRTGGVIASLYRSRLRSVQLNLAKVGRLPVKTRASAFVSPESHIPPSKLVRGKAYFYQERTVSKVMTYVAQSCYYCFIRNAQVGLRKAT